MQGDFGRGFLSKLYRQLNPPEWRKAIRSEAKARRGLISRDRAVGYAVWEEPNRANTKPLHIGKSGQRYSTLTGVWWLDRSTMIVAHRSGLRVGVFDTGHFAGPVWVGEVGHLTDDIAARPTGHGSWEVAVSGCWECIFSKFKLERTVGAEPEWALTPLDGLRSPAKDFCHGVAYDGQGRLCWSIHTGTTPRFAIGDAVHSLPAPWGVRDICHDRKAGRYLAIAVSKSPKQAAYDDVMTTIWSYSDPAKGWKCLTTLVGVHSDALDVWGGQIWIPDQLGDRLLAIDAANGQITAIFSGDCLDFPHGLGISEDGLIAVTNYGSSSVVLLDAKVLLA